MGWKCGREYLFSENEIIKSESVKDHLNNKNKKMKNGNNTNNNTISFNSKDNQSFLLNKNYINNTNLIQNNNFNYNKSQRPELNMIQKKGDYSLSNVNMNNSQYSSIEFLENAEEKSINIDYSQKVISLINSIRANPASYAKIVEDSIKNIKTVKNNQIIYHNVVKVALHRGEQAFRDAIEDLRNTAPMQDLRFNPFICIPLPENEQELKDQVFLKTQVNKLREKNNNIEIYFKDLIKIPEISVLLMIVDDNSKNVAKKRMTLLNKDFKYIGVNSKFIGKNFVAHFAFSR